MALLSGSLGYTGTWSSGPEATLTSLDWTRMEVAPLYPLAWAIGRAGQGSRPPHLFSVPPLTAPFFF